MTQQFHPYIHIQEKWKCIHTHICTRMIIAALFIISTKWKTVWQFLIKLNKHFLCDSVIPLLDIYPRGKKNPDWYVNTSSSFIHNSSKSPDRMLTNR